jgi:flagellar biosynthesis protein FliP
MQTVCGTSRTHRLTTGALAALAAQRGRDWLLVVLIVLCAWTSGAQENPPERVVDLPRSAGANAPGPVQLSRESTNATAAPSAAPSLSQLPDLSNRQNLSSALQLIILLTVLSLAPAILIMMTSFTRIVIVMSLLRQALGTNQLPPNQILIGLGLFMTFLVMKPTWEKVNSDALQPYLKGEIEQKEALDRAQVPLRNFMCKQIDKSDNWEDVYMFAQAAGQPEPKKIGDVGTLTLIPAFVLSELKTAFLLGFKVYLPFLIIDMVISAVLISMGMMMLPPVLISLPFKLLLFVLVDGWHLITGSLMGSFVQ